MKNKPNTQGRKNAEMQSSRTFSCLINVIRISPGCELNKTRIAHHLMIVDREQEGIKFWKQNKPGFVSGGSARVVDDNRSNNKKNWLISATPSINASTLISESHLSSKFMYDDGNYVSVDLNIVRDDGLVPEAPNGSWEDASATFPLSMFAHVARPNLIVRGNIELPGEPHKLSVSGTLWEQHMWAGAPDEEMLLTRRRPPPPGSPPGRRGAPGNSSFVWHWFAMRFEGGMSLQCLSTIESLRPAPCIGVVSLRQEGRPGNFTSIPVPDLQLVSSTHPWTSSITNITFFTHNRFVSKSNQIDVILETYTHDNELPGEDFPYYEAMSRVTGSVRGSKVEGEGVTEKVMRWT